jgi:hypothetical protein
LAFKRVTSMMDRSIPVEQPMCQNASYSMFNDLRSRKPAHL